MPVLPVLRTLVFALFLAGPAGAADGVTPRSVTFGQIADFSGSARALGEGMKLGVEAAFAEANRMGGVRGRQVLLRSVDDGYDPVQSAAAFRRLTAGPGVIGLVGGVGTATTGALRPLAAEGGFAVIAPMTGAGFLRDPAIGNVFNLRASYADEAEAWVAEMVDRRGLKRIGVLFQDDGFGRAGRDGLAAALGRRGLEIAAQGYYTRNTVAVKAALIALRNARPQVVAMVGARGAIVEFLTRARELRFRPEYVTISFVGAEALVADLGDVAEGVVISQVVPLPWDATHPAVAAYQAALAAHAPGADFGFASLEGYLSGRLALLGLEEAGPSPDRAALLRAMTSLSDIGLDGLRLGFGPGDPVGLTDVFLTRVEPDGSFAVTTGGDGS